MRPRFLALHLDAVGFFASLLCAVHCMLLPFLLIFLPLAELDYWLGPVAEYVFIGGSFLISAATLLNTYHRHRKKIVFISMLAGFLLILLGLLLGHSHTLELVLTAVGGLLVALGHFLNWYHGHRH